MHNFISLTAQAIRSVMHDTSENAGLPQGGWVSPIEEMIDDFQWLEILASS